MHYRRAGEPIDPKPTSIQRAMSASELVYRRSILIADDFDDRTRGQLARTQRIINAFAGKWLDHSRGVANKK